MSRKPPVRRGNSSRLPTPKPIKAPRSALGKLVGPAVDRTSGQAKAAFNLNRLKKPSRLNNLRRQLVEELHPTTGKRLSGFETKKAMGRELKRRKRSARAYLRQIVEAVPRQHQRQVKVILDSFIADALNREGAASLANPLFFRELRRRLCGELIRLLRVLPANQVWIYTIVSAEWRLPADQLFLLAPKKLAESLRVNLIRYGKLDRHAGWCATFFHNEHDEAADTYQPHFHVVVVGDKYRAFEALRGLKMFKGGKGQPVYRPIKRQPLRNVVRQISYLIKGYWAAKSSYLHLETGGARRTRKPKRITEQRHLEMLLFLHGLRFADIAWLHGIEIRSGRLRVLE